MAGIRNAAKSGKLAGFMADEAGSVSYEGGKKSRLLNELENSGVKYNPDNVDVYKRQVLQSIAFR